MEYNSRNGNLPETSFKSYKINFFFGILLLTIGLNYGCDGKSSITNNNSEQENIYEQESEWLVPEHEVIDGGPGKDGIPPIEDPKYVTVNESDYIPNERRVLGLKMYGNVRAYPHQILDWHEIVNDKIGGVNFNLTYCPLTATGIAWIPRVGPEFGTSGLIFRNNLVAYDRNTGSLWSQMRLRAINGENLGESMNPLNVIDTKWETWKAMYPNSEVLSRNTGHSRDYNSYAYGKNFQNSHGIIVFPITHGTDTRLKAKERVHAVFPDDSLEESSTVRVYQYSKFGDGIRVISDSIKTNEYLIVGSTSLDFVVAYKIQSESTKELKFEPVQNELPIILKDNEGNKWDVFGEAVEGPLKGVRLKPARSYSGYWYAFRDMFDRPEIYQFGE
ncbi:DUF3179 domain-containing protein [Gracilimonas sp.]|uniref:DUF3179 domain-containing protein n=1 Tax=Gracilimonas sp. TaxID=1974203 RepID=UPI002870D231|nr:DUF3179 domain-containing protein [Gracilimonas sp.]